MRNLLNTSELARRGANLLVVIALILPASSSVQAQPAGSAVLAEEERAEVRAPEHRLTQQLMQRVRENPEDAAGWRALGRALMHEGAWGSARYALKNALRLDPLGVAANFDMGVVAQQLGETELAAAMYQRVLTLAPESAYAVSASNRIEQLGAVELASYEILSFDGSNLLPLVTGPEETWLEGLRDDVSLRLDLGAQYNSNVRLAPSSRELFDGDADSAQGTASLSLRWRVLNTQYLHLGPTFDADFTINEGNLDRFNLQSYRPGVYAQSELPFGDVTLRPRVAYGFTYDEFGGSTFGRKHNLAASLGTVWSPSQISTAYWSIDNNDIKNDGADPNVTSQDGWANTVGLLHDMVNRDSKFRVFRLGADFTNANTDGSQFKYRGVSLFTQGVFVIVPRLHLTTRGGWAFRDYPDFTETPSRNAHIWRSGIELRKYFDMGFSAAIVSTYDRFVSRNDRFDTDRFLIGGTATWEY